MIHSKIQKLKLPSETEEKKDSGFWGIYEEAVNKAKKPVRIKRRSGVLRGCGPCGRKR